LKAGGAVALRRAIDWGALTPLRIRARAVASGLYAGAHRSARRGAGVEFGGFREYTPGDDLRWLDRRALLLHDRYLMRQFETETDRALRLVVDATASMAYRGEGAPASKYAYAALVAAALARISIVAGDPASLNFIGGAGGAKTLPPSSDREQFERIVGTLEGVTAAGDALADGELLRRALETLARGARRGSVVVVLSDLLDLGADAAQRVAALAGSGRVLVVVHVLDPDEVSFPFEGTVRLRSLEGERVVETEGSAARERYLAAIAALRERWDMALGAREARLVAASTADDPVAVVRRVLLKLR
jgi:uncharacterized protein (DUF58 family)